MNPEQICKLSLAQQQASEKAKLCEKFLKGYRNIMGPVNDASELRAVGSQDLLSIRFAILKGVRDDETRKALSINKQLNAVKTDNILDTI